MKKKIIGIAIAGVILVSALAWGISGAVWDETQAVQFTASKYESVENSTLLVGTHLIHLSAMSDAIYETAQTSAEESGQNRIYYKSELADGAWFDITVASSLDDITTEGEPVTTESLTGLYLTHHTKSDGKTYDLRTGQQVSLQDINNPYNIEGLDELFPLKNQYDLIAEQQSESAAGMEKMARIEEIFAISVHNETTDQADIWLDALQRYYDNLTENDGTADELDAVQQVMNAVDASRRVEVYSVLEEEMKTYTEELTGMSDIEGDDGEMIAAEGGDTALQDAANESYSNVSNSLIECEGNMLDPGTTIASEEQYDLRMQLIQEAEANNYTVCDDVVDLLIALNNIQNGVVADRETELEELDTSLLPKSTEKYEGLLADGETDEYRQQKNKNAQQAVLNSVMQKDISKVNTAKSEMEAFIEAKCLRLTNEEGMEFLDDCITDATDSYSTIADDDFSESLTELVDDMISFLQNKKRELELNAGGNELDKLIAQKGDLQTQMMSALDKNDLTGAQEIEKQIEEVDNQILQMQAQQNSELAKLQSERDAVKAQLNAALSGNVGTDDGTGTTGTGDGTGDGTGTTGTGDGTGDGTGTTGTGDGTGDGTGTTGTGNGTGSETGTTGTGTSTGGNNDVASLQKKLAELDTQINGILSNMSDGTVGNMIATLQNECNNLIGVDGADQSTIDALEERINTLGSLLDGNAVAVFPVLKDLHQKMVLERDVNDDNSYNDAIALVEDFILNGSTAYEQALSADKNVDELNKLMDQVDLSDMNDNEKQAAKIAALSEYANQTGSENAKNEAAAQANNAFAGGNPLVFDSVTDGIYQYVPTPAISSLTGMRHVWSSRYQSATLALGLDYYTFSVYSDMVVRSSSGEEVEYMSAAAKYKNNIYVPTDYALEQFGIDGKKITGTELSMAVNEKISTAAEELLSALMLG